VKTAILINRGAGGATGRAAIADALAKAGVEGEAQWLDGADIASAASAAIDDGAKLVIAGGGDGTVSAVAGVLAGTSARLGILPLGTLNHFARDLGIPLELAEAAKLFSAGSERRVDMAEVNGRPFVNNSAIGLYPLMVLDREAQQAKLGRSKRLAMVVAAVRTLLRFSSHTLTLTIDDRTARADTPLLFVGNNLYRLGMPGAGTRERIDGGELSLVLLRRRSRIGFCAATVRALLGRRRSMDVVSIDGVRRLKVDSARPTLTVSLDGETVALRTPLVYRIRPGNLSVVAP
jgi:YegS/Rv2252/BmrU family lipid kinase